MDLSAVSSARVMQLATVGSTGLPWICSVYFVLYQGNFYWLSLSDRRHSLEIDNTSNVALAIVVKQTMPVIGLQAEGMVKKVVDLDEATPVMAEYTTKYNQGGMFLKRLAEGRNNHALYVCVPTKVMYFNENTETDESYKNVTKEFNYARN